MISSIRLDGATACMTIDGATDKDVFRQYVRAVLVPKLRPGDVVVMDNLPAHKDQQAIELIKSAKAKVKFLPPYSPDLNPIEKMWSKVKQYLRNAKARSKESLQNKIAEALKTITAKDAKGWFESCGYTTCHS